MRKSIMKNSKEFQQFQRDHVKLNKTRREQLGEHMDAQRKYLAENLDGFITTERQGSHALGTIIRPTTDEAKADADLMVMMEYNSTDHRSYISALAETLEESNIYRDKAVTKNRCVTIHYSEPSKLEIDLVPCVERDGKFYVCPLNEEDFEETDGTGYRKWFNEQNRITDGHLKRAVRLLKYARDHREKFKCQSIVLTTLAAQTIKDEDEDTEAVSTQADTLTTILIRMSEYLDKTPYPPSVGNPALPSETFNPQWTETEYAHFKETIRTMANDAKSALQETDKEESVSKWQGVCGDKFAPGKGGQNGNSKSPHGPSPEKDPQNNAKIPSRTGRPEGTSRVTTPLPKQRRITPRSPYATPGTGSRTTSKGEMHNLTPLNTESKAWLIKNQPELHYDEKQGKISGTILFTASWDGESFAINTMYNRSASEVVISDKYKITIELKYKTRWAPLHGKTAAIPNRQPPAYTDRKRIENLIAKSMITQPCTGLADLHIHPSWELCTGFHPTHVTRRNFSIKEYIEETLIPWLYRTSYAEKYGLEKADKDLWPAYGHREGPTQYIAEMQKAYEDKMNSKHTYQKGQEAEIRQLIKDQLIGQKRK